MVSIAQDLKTGRVFFSPELEEKELAAIGLVTAQWSLLENVISQHSEMICSEVKITPPKDCTNLSFRKRRKAWTLLIKEYGKAPEQTRLLKLAAEAAALEKDRHKITHGLWSWSYSDPRSVTASSNRQPHVYEKKFDADSLFELAAKIGEVSASITLPNGMESFIAAQVDENGNFAYAGISRRLAQDLIDDECPSPQDEQKPTPPE